MHELRGGTGRCIRVVPEMWQGFLQLCHRIISIADYPVLVRCNQKTLPGSIVPVRMWGLSMGAVKQSV